MRVSGNTRGTVPDVSLFIQKAIGRSNNRTTETVPGGTHISRATQKCPIHISTAEKQLPGTVPVAVMDLFYLVSVAESPFSNGQGKAAHMGV